MNANSLTSRFGRCLRSLILSPFFLIGLSLLMAIWLSLRDYRATVTIELHRNVFVHYAPKPSGSDELFIKTQEEALHQTEVLRPVIERLNLTKALSSNNSPLSFEATRQRVVRSMKLRGIRNTDFLKLSVEERDPQLAVSIANSIAASYNQWCLQKIRESKDRARAQFRNEIERMRAQLEEERRELSTLQDREGIIDPGSEHFDLSQAGANRIDPSDDYAKAKARFLANRRLLEAAELRWTTEQVAFVLEPEPVRIWDPAVPPLYRVYPNRRRLWTGLFH